MEYKGEGIDPARPIINYICFANGTAFLLPYIPYSLVITLL